MSAAASDDDSGSSSGGGDKSIFEQAGFKLQLPWDDAAGAGPSSFKSHSPQWWQQLWPGDSVESKAPERSLPASKSASAQRAAAKPPSQRWRRSEPRVPRYPSVLQVQVQTMAPANVRKDDLDVADIDKYVRAAENAVQTMDKTKEGEATDMRDGKNEPRRPKLGILLIDHGSKRRASNEHLDSIAASYQSTWDKIADVVVRAAHMEIAPPSILDTLRLMIVEDGVTEAICVPYFLSPGKHATIDVPKLISEARFVLDEEGLLDYGEGRVEIRSSEALGSDVEGMLKLVGGLVRGTLEGGDFDGIAKLDGRDDDDRDNDANGMENDKIHETEKELHKYTNRATLLENMLQTKAKQTKTMANRVALMEDATTRLKDKSRKEREENSRQREEEERKYAAQVANLTDVIKGIQQEQELLENESKALALQLLNAEREYNATVLDLEAKLASSEHEMQHLRDEKGQLKRHEDKQASDREDVLQQKIRGQQQQIQELQTQLADLLDAHNELEQLQKETEDTVLKYEGRLKESEEGYESSISVEREEKENYKAKWTEAHRQLEEDGQRAQRMLNKSASEYEVLLAEEKEKTTEWREKWKALNDTQARMGNATLAERNLLDASAIFDAKMEEEFATLQKELEEATAAKANATEKIRELERQLEEQEQQHEETKKSEQKKEEKTREQSQQLQEYLRAQLATYYETIQNQKDQIGQLECKIKDTNQSHEESMLIAKNSVKAAQRREGDLLTNVEELERELAIIAKEKDERDARLSDFQAQLDGMVADAAAAATIPNLEEGGPSSSNKLAQENKKLTMEVDRLRFKVATVSQEKDHLSSEKKMMEEEISRLFFVPRRLRDMMSSADDNVNVIPNKEGGPKQRRRRRWVRGLLRPWTLLRKRSGNDADS